ncbi:unnamed protein product [Amoebophrya sp. A120]|nr:unnamed protein product [Amoebophrya sp. A120]|eukprot:GSA120T00022008001.1
MYLILLLQLKIEILIPEKGERFCKAQRTTQNMFSKLTHVARAARLRKANLIQPLHQRSAVFGLNQGTGAFHARCFSSADAAAMATSSIEEGTAAGHQSDALNGDAELQKDSAVGTSTPPATAPGSYQKNFTKKTGTVVQIGNAFGWIKVDGSQEGEPDAYFRMKECEATWVRAGDKIEFEEHVNFKGWKSVRKVTGGTGFAKPAERPPLPQNGGRGNTFSGATSGSSHQEKTNGQHQQMMASGKQGAEDVTANPHNMVELRSMFSGLVSMVSAQQTELSAIKKQVQKMDELQSQIAKLARKESAA